MKKQVDRGHREVEEWKKCDRVMLSMKNLVFKDKLVKKLMERFVGPYVVEEMKLKLLASMRIYPVIRVVRYREPMKRKKVEEPKLIEVDEVEE